MFDHINNNSHNLSALYPKVMFHRNSLNTLNMWWDKVSLVGKINSLNVPQSVLGNMLETKAEFAELQNVLISNLKNEQLEQHYRKCHRISKALVDIPNRNLFERTADVGFLATDASIQDFLKNLNIKEQERIEMRERLSAYAAKYSVYDEIILFDKSGTVSCQMTTESDGFVPQDAIISEVLSGTEEYWEICRYSDILPEKALSSLFFATVRSAQNQDVIGVLCLSFKLVDEISSLFEDLKDGSNSIFALLDADGETLVSSDEKTLPTGAKLVLSQSNQVISLHGQAFLATFSETQGYQGYKGLGWYGCVLLPLSGHVDNRLDAQVNTDDVSLWNGFSTTLSDIEHRAKIVTEDLDLVVLNGRIAAARRDADEFIPILEEIRQIGRQMEGIFSNSVNELMGTALNTQFSALKFQAALSMDIMDRNLYERANDCRWWALTNTFIECLRSSKFGENEAEIAEEILTYINSLYTVYSGIFLYDKSGRVLAASTPKFSQWLSQILTSDSNWQQALNLSHAQQYCVSPFLPSPYYDQKHTYLYHAAIRNESNVLGGIGLVVDSEPQFRQMLDEVIVDLDGKRHGIYVQRDGKIIGASFQSPWPVGQVLSLPEKIKTQPNGAQGSGIFDLEGRQYVLGYAVSKGYREYKTTDGYENDIIAILFEDNG